MNIQFDCRHFKPLSSEGLHLSEAESDLKATNLCFFRGGKPIVPAVGEFHYARYPHEQWDAEIKKMKAGGISVISTYLMWIYHEEQEGVFDFSGDKDLHHFLQLCQDNHMLVLLRIGPWVHGEVVWGGFPAYIQSREDKRTSSPEYLEKVRALYRAYYEQSRDFFYQNGSVVIGIQLENEYGGRDPEYLPALRRIAIEEGFRLPLYTLTAWPPNGKLDGTMLPTFGRYLERPWTQHTDPLPTDNRFRICGERIDKGIGSDILKDVNWEDLPYDIFPYATCEVGLAVQVYEHRRPIISDRDSCCVAVIQLAQGVNFLGYYLYHGERNPLGRYQESTATGYPNNVPISSYDFQAAISEYGYTRPCYHGLRLIHLFMQEYQQKLGLAQPFFCTSTGQETDWKLSLRMQEDGSGWVFVNNHQRLSEFAPIENVSLTAVLPGLQRQFPDLSVPSGVSAIFPLHQSYGPVTVEYATAQPICQEDRGSTHRYFFFLPEGMVLRGLASGPEHPAGRFLSLSPDDEKPVFSCEAEGQHYEYYLLSQKKARTLYKLQGRVFFSNDTVITLEEDRLIADREFPDPGNSGICLREVPHSPRSGDDYLFTRREPREYRLIVPKSCFESFDDWRLRFHLTGNVAQLYCGEDLMADWFNYNETWEIGLQRLRSRIEAGQPISIVVSPLDRDHPVYLEHPLERDKVELTLEAVNPIRRVSLPLEEI